MNDVRRTFIAELYAAVQEDASDGCDILCGNAGPATLNVINRLFTPDAIHLMCFYGVDTPGQLIDAQMTHVERLQYEVRCLRERLFCPDPPVVQRVREG